MDSMGSILNFRGLMIKVLFRDWMVRYLYDYYLMAKVHNFNILVEYNS